MFRFLSFAVNMVWGVRVSKSIAQSKPRWCRQWWLWKLKTIGWNGPSLTNWPFLRCPIKRGLWLICGWPTCAIEMPAIRACAQIKRFSSSDQYRFFWTFLPAIEYAKLSTTNGGHLQAIHKSVRRGRLDSYVSSNVVFFDSCNTKERRTSVLWGSASGGGLCRHFQPFCAQDVIVAPLFCACTNGRSSRIKSRRYGNRQSIIVPTID